MILRRACGISIPRAALGLRGSAAPRCPSSVRTSTLTVPMCGHRLDLVAALARAPSITSRGDRRARRQHLGEPLVVDARRRDRRLRVHLPVDDVRAAPARVAVMIVGPARGAHDDAHLAARRARSSASSTTAAACRGATAFCSLPIRPNALGTPGCSEKSSISSLSTMPVLPATRCAPNAEVHRRGQRHRVARRRRSPRGASCRRPCAARAAAPSVP